MARRLHDGVGMPALATLAAVLLLDAAFLAWLVTRRIRRPSLVDHAARLGQRARRRS